MDYVNGIEYRNAALEAIYHSEGRVTNIDGTLKYEYAIKDHLGNTRIMFCDRNGDGVIKPENAQEPSEVTQENSYYAFGMNMEFSSWANTPSITDNLYQYNGKELNTDFGLNWEHNDWRFYDPAIGRFWSVDKEAEKPNQVDYSPYHFGFNNPIKNSDPTGLEGEACCGNLLAAATGFINGLVDNLAGTNLRETNAPSVSGSELQSYNNAVLSADIAVLMTAPSIIEGGGGLTAGSVTVTAGSGGLSAEISVPTALAGLAISTEGAFALNNASKNIANSIVKAGDDSGKTHETYNKPPLDPSKDGTYSGRTSGNNSPEKNVADRDKNHHKNSTHGPAVIDKTSKNSDAIRGREQQNIEKNGGAKSSNGTSGNSINGVSSKNKKAGNYKKAANKEFGEN